MTPRPWVLTESTWATVRAAAYEVAILPWGATEAHNTHLPYATDTVQAEQVAIESAQRAWERGAKVVVLPAVPFGVQTGQRELPLCLNANPSTQALLLRDLAQSVAGSGVRKLVVLNGHGGNDFKQMIRELQGVVPLLIAQVNWYQAVDPRPFFSHPGDHAGELETSVMQHLAPGLVSPLAEAGKGTVRPSKVKAFNEGWAWTPRRWVEVTADTGVGDPAGATPAKGAAYFTAACDKLAGFLVELAAADPSALYS
ncbi:MAG TPA: creatininase family protein [Gemmatimonadales bacterium]|nr:creatininase family protein [Gemmatimonadales bacterium]